MSQQHKVVTILRKTALPLWVSLNVFIAAGTIFSGFGPTIDQEYMPFAGLASLTFPGWCLATAALLLLNLLFCRWLAIVSGATMLIVLKPFLIFCPLNFGSKELTPEEEARSFKILSYNVVSFVDEEGKSTPEFNRTMHEILRSDADAVVILEYENQGKLQKFVPQSQIDSLNSIYRFFERGGMGTVMYSKRPILHITPPENVRSKGNMEVFRTSVAGRAVNIFGVHLQSIGLNNDDKELFRSLADTDTSDANRTTVGRVRRQIIAKLYDAFENRAHQAKMLRTYIEQLGGNIIVCGDFNDVPGCRTIHILEEAGLKDAYAETALGPTITYNAPLFLFRIDHVLYRGDMTAKRIQRGDVASSDHYPMLTTFVWD
ncbi:MAG: endonuclease/exonuclease/phosphatase family protein [Bacteroides sp.]|nr:endonuclease/exonuclease/phosphatase family protein [Bacteroides sp.]MCM1379875.1 endonuclease/exonuclease/phosphatase family protein [Bacteroides sp.]MCM1446093.1 endonuclease/exonuclease/phosphatase family protein [Prevotella sp.]